MIIFCIRKHFHGLFFELILEIVSTFLSSSFFLYFIFYSFDSVYFVWFLISIEFISVVVVKMFSHTSKWRIKALFGLDYWYTVYTVQYVSLLLAQHDGHSSVIRNDSKNKNKLSLGASCYEKYCIHRRMKPYDQWKRAFREYIWLRHDMKQQRWQSSGKQRAVHALRST